jgi:hypothetical protein
MPALPPDERAARRRESRRVYQGDHYATVSASIPIDDKIRFEAVCRAAGSTMHREICGFVARRLGYLSEDPPGEDGSSSDLPIGSSSDLPIGSSSDLPIGSSSDLPIGSSSDLPIEASPISRSAFATPPVIFL